MRKAVRILHVDDEEAFVELSANFLTREDADFEVITETSVRDGLERLDAETFDCIVSDYQMPAITGLEFLDRVRERHPSLPFILFTGEGSERVASEALARGVTDYLQKQTGREQYELLANRIKNAVESYRTERELKRYKTLVETVGDAMYILDEDGALVLANSALTSLLGCRPEDVVGMHADEFLVNGGFEAGTDLLVDILKDPDREWGTYEATVEALDGTRIPTEINVAPLLSASEMYQGAVGVVRDLSSRR